METSFNKILKDLREFRGVSQKEMAKRMGVHPARYAHIENPDPTQVKSTKEETLLRIKEALQLSETELLRLFFAAGRIPSSHRAAMIEITFVDAIECLLSMPKARLAGMVRRWNNAA